MAKKWTIELGLVESDLDELDGSIRRRILAAIAKKLESDPERYGEPLGRRRDRNLAGMFKLKVGDDWRVAYWVVDDTRTVVVGSIGARRDEEVYKLAASRLEALKQSDHTIQQATFAAVRRIFGVSD